MKNEEAKAVLIDFNEWRRGGPNETVFSDPKQIGLAIDVAIQALTSPAESGQSDQGVTEPKRVFSSWDGLWNLWSTVRNERDGFYEFRQWAQKTQYTPTEFSASETSLLRAELCKANELYELYKRSFDKMEQLQIAGLRKIERLESELSAANQRISEQSEELRFRHDRIGQISHELLLANQRIAELEADVEEYRQLGMERSERD